MTMPSSRRRLSVLQWSVILTLQSTFISKNDSSTLEIALSLYRQTTLIYTVLKTFHAKDNNLQRLIMRLQFPLH